ncbi:MAG: cytochrome c biogenesis protein CcsA [Rhodospirillaceae bacterium]
MSSMMILSLGVLVCLLPAGILPHLGSFRRDVRYWVSLLLAFAAVLGWTIVQMRTGWQYGLAPALWVSITASLGLFLVLAVTISGAWRLSVLLLPYMLLLSLLAVLAGKSQVNSEPGTAIALWTWAHIGMSVITYALVTLTAIAGLAVLLRSAALKRKTADQFTSLLPAIAEAEWLEIRLLLASWAVLTAGMASGVAVQLTQGAPLLALDHKTVFTFAAFVVIGGLLVFHLRSGVRGRQLARLGLLAYLLLTFAYPGVKFVTEILSQ